mmetsp:Transcript_24483/g.70280  ORF Transcript_24483/g.70280 Transcript_24483/m.70280 type:complete len:462 (-) Transcript_24483:339-1724(-)
MTAMQVMASSLTPRCCVVWSFTQSFSMKVCAYCAISELSSDSPKEVKADMAMAATRSTLSSIMLRSVGMTVRWLDSWKWGAWSLASWPRARSAMKRTRAWGCWRWPRQTCAMASTWLLSSTYSTVCLIAASAACFACHESCAAEAVMAAESAAPMPSISTALTTRSMASSPAWKSSSESSSPSSSSMRAAQARTTSSPSSISSMRSMQHCSTSGGKPRTCFISHFVFLSRYDTSHSSARFRRPSSTPSRERAMPAKTCAGSMLCWSWALKKSGSAAAVSMKACSACCSSSSSFAAASCCTTCTRTPVVTISGAQAFFSEEPTISQTRSRADVLSFRFACTRAFWMMDSSCCLALRISSFMVSTRSFSSRTAASQASAEAEAEASAMRKARGRSAGQPQALPGARLPRGSSLSQTCSASLATTSPIFRWSFGMGSPSKSRSSSPATSCWPCSGSLAKTKSFS